MPEKNTICKRISHLLCSECQLSLFACHLQFSSKPYPHPPKFNSIHPSKVETRLFQGYNLASSCSFNRERKMWKKEKKRRAGSSMQRKNSVIGGRMSSKPKAQSWYLIALGAAVQRSLGRLNLQSPGLFWPRGPGSGIMSLD